jgi:hypothetical protein
MIDELQDVEVAEGSKLDDDAIFHSHAYYTALDKRSVY